MGYRTVGAWGAGGCLNVDGCRVKTAAFSSWGKK